MRRQHGFHQPIKAPAGEGGNRHHRDTAYLRQGLAEIGAQFRQPRLRIVHQIPFVERQHRRPALVGNEIGNLQVLLLQRRGGVHQQDHHLGKADGTQGV